MTTTIFCLLVFRFKFDCRAVAGKQVKGKKWNLFINHFFENFCLFVHIDNYFSVKLSSKKKFFKNDVFSKIKINESHAPASAFTEKIIIFLHYFFTFSGFHRDAPARSSCFQGLGLHRTDAGLYNNFSTGELFTRTQKCRLNWGGSVDAKYYYFHSFCVNERTSENSRKFFDVTESCFFHSELAQKVVVVTPFDTKWLKKV